MFEISVLLSRYLFVICILVFLWNGFIYVINERGTPYRSPKEAVNIQRFVTILMYLTAFFILAFNNETILPDFNALIICVMGLVIIIFMQKFSKKVFRNSCPLIWNGVSFLIAISLIMLYRLNPELAKKQLMWFYIAYFVTLFIPLVLRIVPRFEVFEVLYLILSFALILMTLAFGKEEFGSTNWIKIGTVGFQPSELVKFLYIFYLASAFRKKITKKTICITGFFSALLVLLLVFQKDLGSAFIFFMTYMFMVYIATSSSLLFFLGMSAASVAAVIAYNFFDHVKVRVFAWRNPLLDIDSGGYQIMQSLFAIGAGGIMGTGLGFGLPNKIPVVEKDFIYAAICEEFGVVFGVCVIFIFAMILFRGITIALRSTRRYYALIACGITTMLTIQAFLIIGGVTKFIPLTGVTLPFVSYGGSSVLISMFMICLLQWLHGYAEKTTFEGGDYY